MKRAITFIRSPTGRLVQCTVMVFGGGSALRELCYLFGLPEVAKLAVAVLWAMLVIWWFFDAE